MLLPLVLPKALAEMVGTFTVIFVGVGSILLAERQFIPGLGIPLAWGFIITLMIIILGPVSGAHFNPAVTFAFAIAKRFPLAEVWLYCIGQLSGAFLAIILLGVLKNK